LDTPVTFTATELMATMLPPQKWTVPDLIPEGVIILAGKPKIGKTWLTLGLGVAVSSGGEALGTKPV
jgi:RecA-family ATPase